MSVDFSVYSLYQIIAGVLFIWIGIYLVSRNPYSKISWVAFGILFGFGSMLSSDPILRATRTFSEYVVYQKITDWTLFIVPVLYLHASLLIKPKISKSWSIIINIAYIVALFFYASDIHGGLVLRETVIRYAEYKRFDGFAAGILLAPSIIFVIICMFLGAINFLKEIKNNFLKYFLPAVGGIMYVATAVIILIAYYTIWPWAIYAFDIGCGLGTAIIIYSMIKYHVLTPSENIFNRYFFLKTISIIFILMIYIGAFVLSGIPMTFPAFVLVQLILYLVLFTHSFYDWFNTFLNDFQFNVGSGLSVVSDKEVYEALKNYNQPSALEESSLLRLNLVNKGLNKNKHETPVDFLRSIVEDSIEHFKPKDDLRRTKQNLKYHFLKMFVFDQAEEGQILWELGFEDYPLSIMTREGKSRPPKFKDFSPAEYSYISRNAFIALKKEAIHDVTWRISYLEKLSRRKMF